MRSTCSSMASQDPFRSGAGGMRYIRGFSSKKDVGRQLCGVAITEMAVACKVFSGVDARRAYSGRAWWALAILKSPWTPHAIRPFLQVLVSSHGKFGFADNYLLYDSVLDLINHHQHYSLEQYNRELKVWLLKPLEKNQRNGNGFEQESGESQDQVGNVG
jgi:hypothetical protein